MHITELVTPRNVVAAYNKNATKENYVRKFLFITDSHYSRTISTDIMTSIIDTISLGDGKISVKISDSSTDLNDVKPGVFDIQKQISSIEIADWSESSLGKGIGLLSSVTQNVNDHYGQLCNTLACKALHGNYKHKATKGGNYTYNYGSAIKITASKKITASSTIFDLSAQTDEQAKAMLDPFTSKEDVRILCSSERYKIICAIAKAEGDSSLVESIDEPGIKIDGWYYINDQASYKDDDQVIKEAVPANGSIMVDKSTKSKVLLCDLGLSEAAKMGLKNANVISVPGLPFIIAYDTTKGGLLNDLYFMASPAAVGCLSKIVHSLDQV